VVRITTPMLDVIDVMTSKGLGMSCVVDENDRLVGIVTDGDLRRHMSNGTNLQSKSAGDVMTKRPVTIAPDALAAEALHVLETRKITSIVVVDSANTVKGVVHLHNLWRTGLV
jgi:arabinose-5-phosphate isomerase